MLTAGGAMSGYWAIGRLRIANTPAIITTRAMTQAKIGGSKKKARTQEEPVSRLERNRATCRSPWHVVDGRVASSRRPSAGDEIAAFALVAGNLDRPGVTQADLPQHRLGAEVARRGDRQEPRRLQGLQPVGQRGRRR